MKSELEKFVENNRLVFDDAKPGEKVWVELEKKLPAQRIGRQRSALLYPLLIAASLLAVVSLTIFLWPDTAERKMVNTTEQEVFNNIPEVYVPQIKKVSAEIKEAEKELKESMRAHPEIYKRIVSAYSLFDSAYKNLQAEIKKLPGNTTIVEAMIENLELKKEMLSQELLDIQQFNYQNSALKIKM